MTVAKIAISLPEPLLAHARKQVVRGRAASVSAYVARAVAAQVENDELGAMLDEMLERAGGPVSARERAWADRALGVAKRPARKPRR
jgi:antitoxin ParD1/3/4